VKDKIMSGRRGIKAVCISIILIILSVIMFFALKSEEHFLFLRKNKYNAAVSKQNTYTEYKNDAKVNPPISHHSFTFNMEGGNQVVNMLEIDAGSKNIHIKPVLSFGQIFGFEKLSSIVQKNKAYAAVNAGFFYGYGEPAGMVLIDGKIIAKSTGKYPVLIIENGQARLEVMDVSIWVETSDKRIEVNNINRQGNTGNIILYTPEYGLDNRVNENNVSVIIKDGYICDIVNQPGSTPIPENGMLLTYIGYEMEQLKGKLPDIGSTAKVITNPDFSVDANAYECGSWLLKDGEIVAPDRDEWVGNLNNLDPRTAVGINSKGKLILLTVDGRQPGYSLGMTAKGLAQLMKDNGIIDAALLDGGASSEMIIDGKIVNSISGSGDEKPLGGALIVQYDK